MARKKSKPRKSMEDAFPDLFYVPLKKVERKAWLEFKKLDDVNHLASNRSYQPFNKAKIPINLEHPFVTVIGDFAVASFNRIIQRGLKKDVQENLRHHEVMDCKYQKFFDFYRFYMTIEAIEEGNLGVYHTVVSCGSVYGSRTMTEFILTDDIPTGKIAMVLPRLICLKSKYKTLKGLKRDLKLKLEAIHKAVEGKNEVEVIRLKELHKATKGVCNVLYRNIRSKIPKSWNERSNTEYSTFSRYFGSMKRGEIATCKGYNYRIKIY